MKEVETKFKQMVNAVWDSVTCVWGLCKGPQGILAVGKKAFAAASVEGTVWKLLKVPTLENLWGCCYSEFHKLYCIVGTHVILTSPDLEKWEKIEVKAHQLFKVVCIGRWLIAVDYKIGFWISQDGKTWEQIGLNIGKNWRCLAGKGKIAYCGNKAGMTFSIFEKDEQIVIEKNGPGVDGNGVCIVTPSGVIWGAHEVRKNGTTRFTLQGATALLGGDTKGSDAYLCGMDGTVLYSADEGETWAVYSTLEKGCFSCALVFNDKLILGGERINKEWLAPLVYADLTDISGNSENPVPPPPPPPTPPPVPGGTLKEKLLKLSETIGELANSEALCAQEMKKLIEAM